MKMSYTNRQINLSLPTSVAVGAGISIISTLLGAMFCCSMLSNEKIPVESIGIFSISTWIISSFIGSYISSVLCEKKFLSIAVTDGVYLLVLLSVGLMLWGGNLKSFLIASLSILAGGMLSVIIFMNQKPRHAGKKRYRY